MTGGTRGRKKSEVDAASKQQAEREKEAELLSKAITAAIGAFARQITPKRKRKAAAGEGPAKSQRGRQGEIEEQKPEAIKCSIAEIVKLMQLRREIEAERPRRITVHWVGDECSRSNEG